MFEYIKKEAIEDLILSESLKGRDLINELKKDPFIKKEMESSVVKCFGLLLQDHTEMVLNQFEKYFSCLNSLKCISKEAFRLVLAIHDIGKPRAIREGEKTKQHIYTVPIMKQLFEYLNIRHQDTCIGVSLLSGDPLGSYLKGKNTEFSKVIKEIKGMAEHANVLPVEFFNDLVVYYQVDAGAYTSDAGWRNALDHLFVFDSKNNKMSLSKEISERVMAISENLKG